MTPIEQAATTPTVSVPSMRPSSPAEVAPPLFAATAPATEPRHRGTALAVVAALVCGALGFVVGPVVLGPAAIIGGFAGEHLGRRGTRKLVPAAILAVTLAALVTALVI